MASYKDPSFQARLAASGKAKLRALNKLKAKPPVDEAVMAERRAARQEQEQAQSENRAAKAEANAVATAEKASAKAAHEADADAAAALKARRLTPASAADMKAARDARYAARQVRRK